MMQPVHRIDSANANPCKGKVKFDVVKSSWSLLMITSAIVLGPLTFSLEVFFVFLISTYVSLLVGHSVGMHRMMIHRSFECSRIVERVLIYIGVLVGMAGPFGVIKIHDLRDWAQRQSQCHDFFSHKQGALKDIWWQLTSRFDFCHPPRFNIEAKYKNDRFLQFLENSWPLHQLLPALILYYFGGWSWVVWGIFVRVSISIIGHWAITYFCHNPGPGNWLVKGAFVQASNLHGLGIVTYGECWHNNHHAFPESAKIGLEKGQIDPAWYFIRFLQIMGIAKNVKLPRPEEEREDLEKIH